jgi:hypothetical protein
LKAWPRLWLHLWLGVLPVCVGGCDALGVNTFQGSWIALSLNWPLSAPAQMGAQPQPMLLGPGEHLDLWAQFADGSAVRVPANQFTEPPTNNLVFPGFNVLPALDPNDVCLIDSNGNDLLSAQAQPGPDQELQQMAEVEKVREVVSTTTSILPAGGVMGKAPVPLLALTQYDPPPSSMDAMVLATLDTTPGDAAAREAFCPGFLLRHPDYYQGNPEQLTGAIHGPLFGFFNFSTVGPQFQTDNPATFLPPQEYGGITITSNTSLNGVTGLLLTVETMTPPTMPGMVLVAGVPLPAADSGRGAIRFELVVMDQGMAVPVGTASVLTNLDQELD